MTKKIRVHICTLLIAFLFVTPLILIQPFSVKACPVPQPETLLSLYLNSDLIVVAEFTSQKDGEVTEEYEDYTYYEVTKNLTVSSVWKGKSGRYLSFKDTEYRENNTNLRQPETEYETGRRYARYGYPLYSDLTIGERYLFFFNKNEETGEYMIADEISGYRNLTDQELGVYERRIGELKSIVEKRENQLGAITRWLVKCLEDDSTRWDAVMSLQYSFNTLEYEDEQQKSERGEFVIDENFSEYRPEIAENLSDAQKEFISGIVFSSLPQTIFEENRMNLYYGADSLVKIWDKPRLAMFAYSIFQSVDKTDVKKTKAVMNYIASLTGDERMWELVESYEQAELKVEVDEETVNEETTYEIPSDAVTDSNSVIADRESSEKIVGDKVVEVQETEIQNEEVKYSPAEIRERILREFVDRYNVLLIRNFADEEEEIAQN